MPKGPRTRGPTLSDRLSDPVLPPTSADSEGKVPPGQIERFEDVLAGVRKRRLKPAGFLAAVAGVAPSDPADPPATRVDRGNALFSSLKLNRGERIRTFDFLVPNQAL